MPALLTIALCATLLYYGYTWVERVVLLLLAVVVLGAGG